MRNVPKRKVHPKLQAYYDSKRNADPRLRFWPKVDKISSPYGCWLWVGALWNRGYGHFTMYGKHITAAKASWILNVGPIPNGKFVLHDCPGGDNPACVNPKHLWLGTKKQNSEDMIAKGRAATGRKNGVYTHPRPKGSKNPTAKLAPHQVRKIRALYAQGFTKTQLSERFPVSFMTIYNIVKGTGYQDVI